jgi:hypothetical protein
VINKYTENTAGYRKCKIIDVWRVGRQEEVRRKESFHCYPMISFFVSLDDLKNTINLTIENYFGMVLM